MIPRPFADRRGVALPLALFSLMIAAVMITAVFYVGRLEQRMGNNSLAATQAFEAAEAGLTRVMNNWRVGSYNAMAVGAVMTLPDSAVGSHSVFSATIRRLNSSLFLVQVEGKYLINGLPITRRQLARVARLSPVRIRADGTITALTPLEIGGSAKVSGQDTVPAPWDPVCPAPSAFQPAVGDSSGVLITSGGCAGEACLTGNPKHQTYPGNVTTATFTSFGAGGWSGLVASSDKSVGSGSVSPLPSVGVGSPPPCDTGDPLNWGDPFDPSGPCGQYFPLVYAPGDLNLAGGRGQGILLVEGNLTLSGAAQYYGLIIVQGTINTSGGSIIGGILIRNPTSLPALIAGTTNITWSECVVDRVRSGFAQPVPLQDRSWVQLY